LAVIPTLTIVMLYLIAQMVGAGKLIELLFGLNYNIAVFIVGILMMLYVLFGGMLATTWVQMIKAVLILVGATFMSIVVLTWVGFNLRSEEHTSELQSRFDLVCRLLLEKKKRYII